MYLHEIKFRRKCDSITLFTSLMNGAANILDEIFIYNSRDLEIKSSATPTIVHCTSIFQLKKKIF